MAISPKTKNKLFIVLAIIIITLVIYLIYKFLTKSKNKPWQVEYLNKVYPMANGKIDENGPIFFDDLEFIFTLLLPADILSEYTKSSYKAQIPGPSCQQRSCKCVTNANGEKVPNVQFDPDPIWAGQWPPCSFGNYWSAYGTSGLFNWDESGIAQTVAGPCCGSVENAQKCIQTMGTIDKTDPDCKTNVCSQLGGNRWANFDPWGGSTDANKVNPPDYNQWWKASLHPDYCAIKSKYDPSNLNNFYNLKGDKANTWLEVIHTFFPAEEGGGDGGAWFYRAVGSGIFLNMGNTIIANNKFHMLVKLMGTSLSADGKSVVYNEDDGLNEFVKYLLSYTNDNKTTVIDSITYWDGNLVEYAISFPFWQWYAEKIPGTTITDKLKNFIKGTYNPYVLIGDSTKSEDLSFWYSINRTSNSGGIDQTIISAYKQYQFIYEAVGQSPQQARTLQFTAQPNVYPGWTTEILYFGDDYPNNAISNIKDIPKDQLRVLDPLNIPSSGSSSTSAGSPCNFNYPMKFGYCDILKDTWLNPKIGATDDVTTPEYTECSNFPP